MKNNVTKERETYMYPSGGKKWVDNNLALVLFKHHYLNRFLYKVTYMSKLYINLQKNTKRKHQIRESDT